MSLAERRLHIGREMEAELAIQTGEGAQQQVKHAEPDAGGRAALAAGAFAAGAGFRSLLK